MNIKEFLESNGYKMWKEDSDEYSNSQKYQKRIDILDKYDSVSVCTCNDKLFINIDYWTMNINDINSKSCAIYMIHQNNDDEWCDLKIYSLTEEQLQSNLQSYEDKMVKLWEVFYK